MSEVRKLLNGRYQLIQRLAENAGQQTWVALDCNSQPPDSVIVKLLAMNPQMQWQQAKLLEREAQILQYLEHPRIPKYRDYFVLEKVARSRFPWFCLVQDQVPGKSLQQLLDEGYRFSEAEIETIASEVLAILSYLHHGNPPILHRDLKPSNLMRGDDGCMYLIDFGAVQDQAALEGATFTVVGTYGYVPMEQFGGRAVPASDLYALGATLIHLLTGVPPADLPQVNGRIQFAQAVGVDRALANWVAKLTEPSVENRFPTADLALDALRARSSLCVPLLQHRPKGSKIQLNKSINQLTITIPHRGIQGVSGIGFLGSFMLLVILFPIFTILFPIFPRVVNLLLLIFPCVFFPIFLRELCALFSAFCIQTVISINATHFTIWYKLFGFTYWKRHSKITTAWVNEEDNSFGRSVVKIHIGKKTFCTNPMAGVEQQWLIQEITDWLEDNIM